MKKRSLYWLMFSGWLFGSVAYADVVTDWNAVAGKAAVKACISPADDPLHESRLYAMMHVAIHDALNAIDLRYRSYVFRSPQARWASVDAAVATAAHDVLVPVINQIPEPFSAECRAAGVTVVEAAYAAALQSASGDAAAKAKGIEIGRAAAAAIVALRANDGSDTPLIVASYKEGEKAGEYRFTPGFPFAFAPGWGDVTPFALSHPAQFPPPPPYNLNSHKYAADFDDVKRLGGDGIITPSERTADDTEKALFWVESSPLLWNRVGRTVSAIQRLDTWENARLFGMLNIALADGYISSWNAKFRFNFWRPVTAIQMADIDGNASTAPDPSWTPLLPTPPIPDHDSGHSVEGAAAAEVFRRVFGTDNVSFSICSFSLAPGSRCDDANPVFRQYRSFTQAEEENGRSRVLVGFHFQNAVNEGIQHGRKIAAHAVNVYLRPLPR